MCFIVLGGRKKTLHLCIIKNKQRKQMERIAQQTRGMPKAAIKIKAAIKFGMQSKNCQNHGICEITMLDDEKAQPCDTCTQVLLLYKPEKNTLTLKFLKASMSLLTTQKYFANNVFLLEESYYLSIKNIEALLLDEKNEHYLLKGTYPIQNNKDYLSVTFAMINNSSLKKSQVGLPLLAFVSDGLN
jgi:hypothetical protein